MVSHLKQRHGFTEHKVSHVELRPNSHRRQGLLECKVSEKARFHRGSNIMNKGRVSEKEGPHRRQRLTEARVSQKARPHGSQGLTEGQVSQKVSQKGFTEDTVSPIEQSQAHRRQGGAKPSLATGMRITYDAMQGLTQ